MIKVHKKKTHPGEVLMWFSVALIIIGIVLGISSYIGDFSIVTMSAIMIVVGVAAAILAKSMTK